ncbi:MAG: hypothetical protein ACJ8CB_24230, partial [Ktedonobacteraceae bacterium]
HLFFGLAKAPLLVIPHKSEGYVSQVCWKNARHRSFAALRMTQSRAVILSAAKDLSRTYGESPAPLLRDVTRAIALL